MNEENKFSTRIKRLRQECDMSQEELGKLVGVSKVSVWQWENGINYPNNNVLLALADYFKVSTDYLLGKSDVRNISDDRLDDIDLSAFPVGFLGELSEMSKEQIEQLRTYARFLKQRNDDDD